MTNFAQDMRVKQAWGKTLDEWNRASEKDRRDWRDRITEAPNFKDN